MGLYSEQMMTDKLTDAVHHNMIRVDRYIIFCPALISIIIGQGSCGHVSAL
jgi:hypothetical protein